MHDNISIIDKFRDQLAIFDVVQMIFHLRRGLQVADVFYAAGGQIIEEHYVVAASNKTLG
jgi:hypothetical protein